MDKAEVKSRIESEITKTQEKIAELEEMTNPVAPDDAIGRISRMDAINNKSINDAAMRKAKDKLKGLNFALSRVDDPEFGQCAKCKGEIPLPRILLMPQSRFCVNCAG